MVSRAEDKAWDCNSRSSAGRPGIALPAAKVGPSRDVEVNAVLSEIRGRMSQMEESSLLERKMFSEDEEGGCRGWMEKVHLQIVRLTSAGGPLRNRCASGKVGRQVDGTIQVARALKYLKGQPCAARYMESSGESLGLSLRPVALDGLIFYGGQCHDCTYSKLFFFLLLLLLLAFALCILTFTDSLFRSSV